MSRHELSLREPALASGFVYQLLYGIALTELFAELRSEVDARLRERAAILLARIKAEAESSTRERRMEHLLRLVDADEHLIIPVWED